MAQVVNNVANFRSSRAWGALELAEIDGASVRLHWTDAPYHWHVNDGAEVFIVLNGTVHMHYRDAGNEKVAVLETGDIFVATEGDEHLARPDGEARIVVVERCGSV